jgi:hypothetical protein
MHNTKGILAIIVSLGLALALLLPLSITGANGPSVTVGIVAPAEVGVGSSFVANVTVSYVGNFDSCHCSRCWQLDLYSCWFCGYREN